MNKKIVVPAVVILATMAIVGATAFGGQSGQSTDDAYVEADYTLVAPKVSGIVSEVAVEDNQRVHAGDLLARIDDRDFKAALEIAQADQQAAAARLANAVARDSRQQAVIAQAKASVEADDAALVFARQNAARYGQLSQVGAGTQEQQQQAQYVEKQQTALRDRDSAALDAAQREVTVLASERAEAEGAVARAQAAVQQAELNLGYTRITAPVDGVVGERSVRVGAYVSAGTTMLAVVPLSSAYVVGNFRETQLARVKPGQPVVITVDALPGVTLRGKVDSVAPATGLTFAPIAPENATGNFTKVVQRIPVKIVLDENQPAAARLHVGMSVIPTIDIASK
ncbi:HlyD family secretion protein [Paraburkholderia bannensis]|uniref:HlyD family secretion protein n=1 Tax=Paraburkholderia bannensis TaxID=765414 RepID=UPI002AB69A71|nr:HlyD family secretion protein [Paraburkholderia bannensis]